MGELNSLLNVALQASHTGLKQLLLLVIDLGKNVDGLLGTVGLHSVSDCIPGQDLSLTPSSIGTEKKSQPVSLWIASPPGTPCR